MKTVNFKESNCRYDDPNDKNEPIWAHLGSNGNAAVFCLKLTDEEVMQLQVTKEIWLTQQTFGKPLQITTGSIDCPFMRGNELAMFQVIMAEKLIGESQLIKKMGLTDKVAVPLLQKLREREVCEYKTIGTLRYWKLTDPIAKYMSEMKKKAEEIQKKEEEKNVSEK